MTRTRLLAVIVGMLATLAVTAVPAFAEFQSTSGKPTGIGTAKGIVLEGGGATLECVKAEGTGTILSAAKGKEQLKGPVLQLKTTKWNECKAKSSEFKELKPKVKACALNLTQKAGQEKALGSVASECTVETTVLFLTCTIHVSAEKESPPVNFGLESNALENVGNNLIITAEDSGVTTTTSGTCPGVSGSSTGKQKAIVEGEGANWS
jgi:hypothetical protein